MRLSGRTWILLVLAFGSSAVLAHGGARLWRRPPAPAALGDEPFAHEKRLVLASPDGVLLLEESNGWRIDAGLRRSALEWKSPVWIDHVDEVAVHNAQVGVLAASGGNDPLLLLLDGKSIQRKYDPPPGATAALGELEVVGDRFQALLAENLAVYQIEFGGDWPVVDRRRSWEAAPRPRGSAGLKQFFVTGDALRPITDEPAIVTNRGGVLRSRVRGAWHDLASAPDGAEYMAVPIGDRFADRFLVLPKLGARWAMLLDGAGARLDRVGRVDTVRALTGDPSVAWAVLLALVALSTVVLPAWAAVAAARARRSRLPTPEPQPGARGAFFGVLRAPGGALETDAHGHVAVSGPCSVQVGAYSVALGAGLTRADGRGHVPLIDGDEVFVVGTLEGDAAGGPWRGSQQLRLAAAGAIGRGTRATYGGTAVAAIERPLTVGAVAHVVAALLLLLRFGASLF
jgi:hypothetical protein